MDANLNRADIKDAAAVSEAYWAAVESEVERRDLVNHPPHYETGGIECIDAMVETQGVVAVMDFCICNAFKYLWRHGRKNGIEDVRKAIWYLNKYVELADKGNYPPTTNL